MFRSTSTTRRLRNLGALVAVGALALSACAGGGDPDPDSDGDPAPATDGGPGEETADPGQPGDGEFTVGLAEFFVQNLMPGNSGGSYVNNALFTPLTTLDPDTGEVVNGVAESVESEDNQTWHITLQEGWTFHDGEAVTAQSFADSWNATATPANAMTSSYLLSVIEGYAEMNPAEGEPDATELSGVEVVGDYELTVRLNEPNALFEYTLASTAYAPIPTSAAADFTAFNLKPIGNGPFQISGEGFTPGSQEVVLERYDDYAGEVAQAKTVRLKAFQDTSAIYTDFQAGGVDMALLDGTDLSRAQEDYPGQVVDVIYPALIWLGLPTWLDQFEDPDLRKALSQAIDRDTIIEVLLRGNGERAVGAAPAVLPGGGERTCEHCELDAAAAKTLYDSTDGIDGTLKVYTYTDPTNQLIVEAIANQLRTTLGIEAVAETVEISALYDGFTAESTDGAFMLYSGTSTPNVYGLVEALFNPPSFLNATHFDNDEVTGLLQQAVGAADVDELTQLTQEAERIAMAEARVLPLFHPKGGILHRDNLSGVQPELLGGPHLARVQVSD